jgi:hypothetical protein
VEHLTVLLPGNRLLALTTNIRLGYQCLAVASTLGPYSQYLIFFITYKMGPISQSVCLQQTVPTLSNICGYGQEPVLE